MATCRDITKGALRKIGKLGAGREPRDVDASDALEALKSLYRSLINSGAFGRLRDVTPLTDYVAGENERIFRTKSDTLVISLPELVDDDGASYSPLDCSVVVVSDAFTGLTSEFIYDANQHQWQSLYDLADDSIAPLSGRDEEGLKALLALQLVDEYGGTLGAATARQAGIFQSSLISRFSMPQSIVAGEFI